MSNDPNISIWDLDKPPRKPPKKGDLWFDRKTYLLWIWNGKKWVKFGDNKP